DEPFMVHLVEERLDVGVQYEAHLLAVDSDAEGVQRVVRAAPRPESVREPEEVLLIDRVQQRDYRPLNDLVLQGSNRERALSAIWLGYVHSPAWPRPIRSASDPVVQIFEIALEVCLVVLPCQPVHTRCRVRLEFVERVLEKIDADVVEERDELLLLPFPCDFPYALQRMWHADLALCPVHGLLARISLGPRPWLPRLRAVGTAAGCSAASCSTLFAGFMATMAGSDFSCLCIIGYGSSPSPCGPAPSPDASGP